MLGIIQTRIFSCRINFIKESPPNTISKCSLYRRNMSVNIESVAPESGTQIFKENSKRKLDSIDEDTCLKIQKTDTVERIKRRPHAMLLSYLGTNYFGMQRNPKMKTIEEDLLNALLKADLVTQEGFEYMQTIKFQRAARTDKGVSATRQIVSLRLPEPVDKNKVNQFLPEEIRVFGVKRVTKGFNSKSNCNARTYSYTLPTYAFAPESDAVLPDREEIDEEKRFQELSIIDGKSYNEYRIPDDILSNLKSVLKKFEGTHNFHNYTSKVRPLDPRAKRYIMSFECSEKFVHNGTEFVTLLIRGQSFMLHQIRKMIATVIAIIRNYTKEDFIEESYLPEKKDIPLAPSLGLVLNYVHYDQYNKRYGNDGIHEKLDWTECDDEVKKFEKEYILKHILDTEVSDKIMLKWLALLTRHSFKNRDVNVDGDGIGEDDGDGDGES